jgi:hypothetical protein
MGGNACQNLVAVEELCFLMVTGDYLMMNRGYEEVHTNA